MTQAAPTEIVQLIALCDLTGFAAHAEHTAPTDLGDLMDAHYEDVGDAVARAGGRVVKFIGDAALAVFAPEQADAAVIALLDLARKVEASLAQQGWNSRLIVRVHVGPVAAGHYGARNDKRFDILGRAVNTCAGLPATGVSVSPEVFARLSPATRTHFQQHAPVVYLRSGDAAP